MTTITGLPKPGTEVLQVFRTVSPTVVTPTLPPCVVGVCKQVVEVLSTTSTGGSELNSDALVSMPAFFLAAAATGVVPKYTGLNGLALVFSANNGANITVTFVDASAAGLTPATVVSQVRAALTAAGATSVQAYTVGDDQWILRTVGVGSSQSIYIDGTTNATVATAFGVGLAKTYPGLDMYNQYIEVIPDIMFPDPRGNIDELVFDSTTVRAFLATGNGAAIIEALRTSAYCRGGEVNDLATITGSADIDAIVWPGALPTKSISLKVDGETTAQTHTFAALQPTDLNDLLSELNAAFSGVTFTTSGSTNLVMTSDTEGYDSSIEVVAIANDCYTELGFTVAAAVHGKSIKSIDDGNGDATTPILEFYGETFSTAPGAATVTASAAPTVPLTAGMTLIISDGQQPQTIVFTEAINTSTIVTEINAVMGVAAGGLLTASGADGAPLALTHTKSGTDSVIKILGGTALANLDPGGTPALVVGTYRGAPSAPEPGDELYVDGAYYADIVQVAPGADTTRLKINRQVTIASDVGSSFYIMAKNLPSLTATRPLASLTMGANGEAIIKQELLRDTMGTPIVSVTPVYLVYQALRLDVTARAETPGLLTYSSTTDLEDDLAPLTVDNPLGLGMYFALLNAPGVQVMGLGVDSYTADMPYGTVEGFTRAAEYLEAHEVYGISPLTHDETVAQVYLTHGTSMSEPEAKGERIILWNPVQPDRARNTLVASGTNGNTIGGGGLTFDTGIANLPTLILGAGVDPTGTIPATENLFLDIAGDAKSYSIASVSGSQLTLRNTFATGENDDLFFSTTVLPVSIQETFAVRIRGEALVTIDGDIDKDAVAEAYYYLGQGFNHRRFWMIINNGLTATLGGLEQLIEGFYGCAAISGMIANFPPQQSFTNVPMTGFTGVKNTNKYFKETQLNIIAAGGGYILIQEADGAPVIARMALTTDMTSIETRTDSITKVVDFTSKFFRRGARNFIGRFNITQGLLDSLGTVFEGLGGFLVENGVLIAYHQNNIIQDEEEPDVVLLDSVLDVPYPCNYLRITLVV